MHPRIVELNGYLAETRDALRQMLDAIDPAHREAAPGPGRWSVAQVIEHLALIERLIASMIASRVAQARAEGVGPDTETSAVLDPQAIRIVLNRDYKIVARDSAQPTRGLDTETAYAELEQARAALLDVIASADGVDLTRIQHPHPVLGSLNGYQWIGFVGAHEARHTLQIREAADAVLSLDGSPR